MSAGILSSDERDAFIERGYFVRRGLLPQAAVADARERICRRIGQDWRDPATWRRPEGGTTLWDGGEDCVACQLPAIQDIGRALAGPEEVCECTDTTWWVPVLNYPVAGPPRFAGALWRHVDLDKDSTVWPSRCLVVVFAYLTDTARHGGATVVFPGSHRIVFERNLGRGVAGPVVVPEDGLGEPEPLAGAAGDVVFMHYLTVHGGSPNHGAHIRVGLNTHIARDPARAYQPKLGTPTADWTPLEWTLRTDRLGAEAQASER